MPVGQDAPQFVLNGVLSLTPVPPSPQYSFGFLPSERYCWWHGSARLKSLPSSPTAGGGCPTVRAAIDGRLGDASPSDPLHLGMDG